MYVNYMNIHEAYMVIIINNLTFYFYVHDVQKNIVFKSIN